MNSTLYIPFWLYSNTVRYRFDCSRCGLYIPFWLYSNKNPKTFIKYTTVFTFHSGYIPMETDNKNICISYYTLHSILVIFQCHCLSFKSFPSAFTFHSGYIPIAMLNFTPPFIFSFTFHSGYIPMRCLPSLRIPPLHFTFHSGYIPMNLRMAHQLKQMYFTFHSGYIPIKQVRFNGYDCYTLHSILVIFQWRKSKLKGGAMNTLHSILVIFQCSRYGIGLVNGYLYIPFWLYSNVTSKAFENRVSLFTFHSGYIPILSST